MAGPGGHRGRSGQNGAGNHRYTDEEREMLTKIRAEAAERDAVRRADARKRRSLERMLATRVTKMRDMLSEHAITCLSNYRRWQTIEDWQDTPVKFKCDKGHEFEMTGEKFVNQRGKHKCPVCAQLSKGDKRKLNGTAESRLARRLDEQGLSIVGYFGMHQRCAVRCNWDQTEFDIYPKNAERWSNPSSNGEVWYTVDNDKHVFVWLGMPEPAPACPKLRKLLEGEHERADTLRGLTGLTQTIQHFIDDGCKVVNISRNPSLIRIGEEENTYEWGQW